jgi:hypothetical protein
MGVKQILQCLIFTLLSVLIFLFILYAHKYNVNGGANCLTIGFYFIGLFVGGNFVFQGKKLPHTYFSNSITM